MWGYDHLAFGVGLVVTELLTNSMRHTTSERARLVVQVLSPLLVVGRLVVVVHDDDPTMPTERRADDYALDGRGLALVRGLADNLSFVPAEHGKEVVAAFSLATEDSEATSCGADAGPSAYEHGPPHERLPARTVPSPIRARPAGRACTRLGFARREFHRVIQPRTMSFISFREDQRLPCTGTTPTFPPPSPTQCPPKLPHGPRSAEHVASGPACGVTR